MFGDLPTCTCSIGLNCHEDLHLPSFMIDGTAWTHANTHVLIVLVCTSRGGESYVEVWVLIKIHK